MEAFACGTPGIAFPSSAHSELIEHGRTGFIVKTVEEMADALTHVQDLDPAACRQSASNGSRHSEWRNNIYTDMRKSSDPQIRLVKYTLCQAEGRSILG